jgi:hypothetical protein
VVAINVKDTYLLPIKEEFLLAIIIIVVVFE